ncbi:hypothetical protein F5Y01DRAFT_317171 [Xylaria sp. FL0043]|nr:hypothetical protein F5Y01DRAFT_317171 [Xylaria sp. FL0043]
MAFSRLSAEILDCIIDYLDAKIFEDGIEDSPEPDEDLSDVERCLPPHRPRWAKLHPQDQEKHESLDLDDCRHLASYATISRLWQQQVERRIFSLLTLDEKRLTEALNILTPVRLEYIKAIDIRVAFDHESMWWRDAHLAYKLKKSFQALRLLKQRLPSASSGLTNTSLRIRTAPRARRAGPPRQYLQIEDLPPLDFIGQLVLGCPKTHFPMHKRGPWFNSPAIFNKLLEALPAVGRVFIYPFCPRPNRFGRSTAEQLWNGICYYNSIHTGLKALSTEIYDKLSLRLCCGKWPSQYPYELCAERLRTFDPEPGLIQETMAALRQASTQVEDFHFRGRLEESFFYPTEPKGAAQWPNLSKMHLVISPFVGRNISLYQPRDFAWTVPYGHSYECDEEHARPANQCVCEPIMNRFLALVADAIIEMPKLTHFQIEIYFSSSIIHKFDFHILSQRAQVTWSSWPLFKPCDSVLESFQALAENRGCEFKPSFVELPCPVEDNFPTDKSGYVGAYY